MRIVPGETLRMALDNVRSHKLRSVLTVLGVVIGVLVVVVIASILTGLRKNIITMIEEYGTNNIFAFHLSTGPRLGPRDRAEFRRKPLRPEDGLAIKEQASAVEDVANTAFVWLPDGGITYQGTKYRQGELQGVSANYLRIVNFSLREGRFFTDDDDEARRPVAVIGINVAEALFPHKSTALGTEIRVGGTPFKIVGVLDKRRGGFLGENEEDNLVLMPYRTARRLAPQTSEWMMLVVRARSGQLPAALDQVEEVLRRRRGVRANQPSNFDLSTADRFIEQFDAITAAIGLVAIAISSVGLLVGGIGVMNIMLVSVTERTQEIGVRKALGARRRDIVRQFLFEAMALTFLGGVIGVALAFLISRLLLALLPSLPAEIPAWAVAAGLSVSIGVGLVAGVWPAKRAAALDPVEALRYE
ncbi:MAG TPA: ABC transporter permease [Vicinamibacteria bacterium]